MREVNYKALREATQNYQSTLAWYQAIPNSPNVERDCGMAFAAFRRHIRRREADIIASLPDGLEEVKSQLNEQHEYYEGVISDGSKRITGLGAREVQPSTRYDLRYGHPINAGERHAMVPKENGSRFYPTGLEHALRVAGIHIKREEHGNKTRG